MSVSTSCHLMVLQTLFTLPPVMKGGPTFLSTFGVSVLFHFAYLEGVQWYLVVLICIFLITVEARHTRAPLLSILVLAFLLTPVLEAAASTCV